MDTPSDRWRINIISIDFFPLDQSIQTNGGSYECYTGKHAIIIGTNKIAAMCLGTGERPINIQNERETNKRGDLMKQWLMLQKFVALSTMYRETLEKQVTYRTPKGVEKQLDYILVDRKHVLQQRR